MGTQVAENAHGVCRFSTNVRAADPAFVPFLVDATLLGVMHGPSFAGDCPTALRDLADAYDERLGTEGFRLHGPVAPGPVAAG